MKLMQRFRKKTSRQDMEAQAAQELQAAMAAKPTDVPAMAPAAGLPGDDMNGSAGAGETPGAPDTAAQGENGEPLGSVTELPKRRPTTARKTGPRKSASTPGTAGGKTAAIKAKPAAGGRTPVTKPAAKKAAASSAGGTVKKRPSASGAGGTAKSGSSARQPAAKKR